MNVQNEVTGIVTLIVGVSLSVIILIFMLGLGGQVFVNSESTINSIGSESTVSNTDAFTDDTENNDPSSSWYVYTEVGWDYANVTKI